MRIGIDARKLHDFGIGTYIRNLLLELAKIDQTTEYVLITRPQDDSLAASLGENFRTVADTSGHYSIAEQISIPRAVRREKLDLFHAPHYVLPALTPSRSVVTIPMHPLMFPEYLRHRLGHSFARAPSTRPRISPTASSGVRAAIGILKFSSSPPGKIIVTRLHRQSFSYRHAKRLIKRASGPAEPSTA